MSETSSLSSTSFIRAQFARDAKSALRSGGGWFHTLYFFAMFAGFSVFAVGPERALLMATAPGLLWLGAALALQLSSVDLFAQDYADGTLRTLAAEHPSLWPYFIAKFCVIFLLAVVPIAVLAPLYYVLFAFDPASALKAALLFMIGCPALVLAAILAAAMSAGMRTSGVLGAGFSAPVIVPVLIFGVGATERLSAGAFISPELLILCALMLVYFVVLPPFVILALRFGLE